MGAAMAKINIDNDVSVSNGGRKLGGSISNGGRARFA